MEVEEGASQRKRLVLETERRATKRRDKYSVYDF